MAACSPIISASTSPAVPMSSQEHARRRQLPGRQHRLQRVAERRHRDRARRADHGARRTDRHARACASRAPSSTGSGASTARSTSCSCPKNSPVKTIDDARRSKSTLASTGAGSASSNYPTVLNNVVGTRFKLILGYRGSNDSLLAMERGEAEGHSTAWNTLKVARPEWLRTNAITMLVQFAAQAPSRARQYSDRDRARADRHGAAGPALRS